MSSVIPYSATALRAHKLFLGREAVPAGLVSDAVLRSWRRCMEEGRTATERVVYGPVAPRTVSTLLESNRQLIAAAAPAMRELAEAAAGIGYGVLLTDARGIALATHGPAERGGYLMRAALRPGIDLSESAIGTNAMAGAIAERLPMMVDGAEHFFAQNHAFQCAAAPVFDPGGMVVGAIDLSRDAPGPQCDVLSLVAECAAAVETALFLQLPAFVAVALSWRQHSGRDGRGAMVAFGPDGEIVAINPACRALAGLANGARASHYGDLFCGRFSDFVVALRTGAAPVPLRTHAGMGLYGGALAAGHTPGAAFPSAARGAAGTTLPCAHQVEFGDDRMPGRLAKARRALAADLPVLVVGETGTGKEVAARALHDGSRRARGPLVALNCAAIPRELIEGELFGHAEGAFTGARRGGAQGKIAQADRGTLFLDEVGDMPSELQTRLLRVLETREVTRLGDALARKVDFQLVCATHKDLERLVEDGLFREDLYYRINGFVLELPPLRERNGLAVLFARLAEEEKIAPARFSQAVLAIMQAYAWPGNVRELRHALRYARAMCDDDAMVTAEHLPERMRRASAVSAQGAEQAASLKAAATRATEAALRDANGNVTDAARQLGVSRSTLHRWLRAHR